MTKDTPDFFSLAHPKRFELWCTEGLASVMFYKLFNQRTCLNFVESPSFHLTVQYSDQRLVITGTTDSRKFPKDIDVKLSALLKSRLGPDHPLCHLPIVSSIKWVSHLSSTSRFIGSATRSKSNPDHVTVRCRSNSHIGTHLMSLQRTGAAWACYIAETLVTLKLCNHCTVTATADANECTCCVVNIESDMPLPAPLHREISKWSHPCAWIGAHLELRQLSPLRALEMGRPAGLPDFGPDVVHRPFFCNSRSIGQPRKKLPKQQPLPMQETMEEVIFGMWFNLGLRRLNSIPFSREAEYHQAIGEELPRWTHILSARTADTLIEQALERHQSLPIYPGIDHHAEGMARILSLSGEEQKKAVRRVLFSLFTRKLVMAETDPEPLNRDEYKELERLPLDYQKLFEKKPPVWVKEEVMTYSLLKFAVETGYELPDVPPILLKDDEDFIGFPI